MEKIQNHSRPDIETKTIEVTCIICGTNHTIIVPKEDYDKCWRWRADRKGLHIQDAMPYLSPGTREMLISSICEDCFDKMFGE